jgi:hypothetical protein
MIGVSSFIAWSFSPWLIHARALVEDAVDAAVRGQRRSWVAMVCRCVTVEGVQLPIVNFLNLSTRVTDGPVTVRMKHTKRPLMIRSMSRAE